MAVNLNSRKVSCKWIVVSLLSLLSININFFSRNHVYNRIMNWYCTSICQVFSNTTCNSESDRWGILILCFSVKHKNALSPFPMIRNTKIQLLFINSNAIRSNVSGKKKHEKRSFFPQIKLSSNIDFRAVLHFFQLQAFLPQKSGKVARFH